MLHFPGKLGSTIPITWHSRRMAWNMTDHHLVPPQKPPQKPLGSAVRLLLLAVAAVCPITSKQGRVIRVEALVPMTMILNPMIVIAPTFPKRAGVSTLPARILAWTTFFKMAAGSDPNLKARLVYIRSLLSYLFSVFEYIYD